MKEEQEYDAIEPLLKINKVNNAPPTLSISSSQKRTILEQRLHGALKTKEKRRINELKILQFDSRDKLLIAENTAHVVAFMSCLGLDASIDPLQIEDTLQQAHMASDEYYTISHAQKWNTDFEFPQEAVQTDMALFTECGHDFTQMCQMKQTKLAANRLSVQRVIDTFGPTGAKYPTMASSDFSLLLEFAQHGITPIYSTEFVPESTNLPPLRARYVTLKHTINKLLFKQYLDGTMIMLPTVTAKTIPGMHFSPQHHADTKGKQEGRVIGDLSGQHEPTYTPLNGTVESKTDLRLSINKAWGEIKHPTVDQLVFMVLTASDIHGWNNLILWKKDLKGAFNLLNYNPAFCRLFAFELSDGITMIHLAGLFGWIGMPHAFQVLTRSLQALCTYIIMGLCMWYVDDLMAVSNIATYVTDSFKVDQAVQQLLGQGSIAQNKSQCGRALEFLGWIFDLDSKTITLCPRNLYKLVHALFSFDLSTKVSISHIQRMASLTSRASILNRHMRSFTHTLHTITIGYDIPNVKIPLSDLAKSDIIMWRSYVLALVAQPLKLSRTIESFRPTKPTYCFKYDASLTRIAVGLFNTSNDSLIVYSAVDLPFPVNNESKRQNTVEFIAIIFGLLLCWRWKITVFHYDLHGDSVSSLAWAQENRVNSIIARRSNLVFTTLSMHLDCHVATTKHIPGKMNVIFDGLSRNRSPDELGLDPTMMYNASMDIPLLEFLSACDPEQPLVTITDHIELLCTCRRLLLKT